MGKLSDEDLTVFRRRCIGFIFQNYNLVPILNVYENTIMLVRLDGKKPDEAFIQKIVTLLGLEKSFIICRTHYPAVNNSVCQLQGHWRVSPRLSLPTSQPEIWTAKQATKSLSCLGLQARPFIRQSS